MREAEMNTPKGLSGIKRLPSLSPSDDDNQSDKKFELGLDDQLSLCQQLLKDYGGLDDSPLVKHKSGSRTKSDCKETDQMIKEESKDILEQLTELLRISQSQESLYSQNLTRN